MKLHKRTILLDSTQLRLCASMEVLGLITSHGTAIHKRFWFTSKAEDGHAVRTNLQRSKNAMIGQKRSSAAPRILHRRWKRPKVSCPKRSKTTSKIGKRFISAIATAQDTKATENNQLNIRTLNYTSEATTSRYKSFKIWKNELAFLPRQLMSSCQEVLLEDLQLSHGPITWPRRSRMPSFTQSLMQVFSMTLRARKQASIPTNNVWLI